MQDETLIRFLWRVEAVPYPEWHLRVGFPLRGWFLSWEMTNPWANTVFTN